jgi:hypothetical protein
MAAPFLASSMETTIPEAYFDTELEAQAAFRKAAAQMRFGPKVRSGDKDRKKVHWQSRYECTMGGNKDGRNKVDGLDSQKARVGRSQKNECPFKARAVLDRDTGKWKLETQDCTLFPSIHVIIG